MTNCEVCTSPRLRVDNTESTRKPEAEKDVMSRETC